MPGSRAGVWSVGLEGNETGVRACWLVKRSGGALGASVSEVGAIRLTGAKRGRPVAEQVMRQSPSSVARTEKGHHIGENDLSITFGLSLTTSRWRLSYAFAARCGLVMFATERMPGSGLTLTPGRM